MKKARPIFVCVVLLGLTLLPPLPSARAGVPVGAMLPPYEVHNVATDSEYSPWEALRGKAATVAYFASIKDPQFWADCQKLQALQAAFPNVGVFAQLVDGGNASLLAARARESGVTIPIVYAVGDEWKEALRVKTEKDMSHQVYLSRNLRLEWSAVGLTDQTLAELTRRLKLLPASPH